jgi:anthranilate phosphoribosyltransferase
MPDRDRNTAAVKMYQLLAGRGDSARLDAIILNSALIFLVRGMVATISKGVEKAREILLSGQALATLARWVEVQNSDPAGGLLRLASLARAAG